MPVYQIYYEVNAADTSRDPDQITRKNLCTKKTLESAMKFAEDYIQKNFFRTDTKISDLGNGIWRACDFCSYPKVLYIQELKVKDMINREDARQLLDYAEVGESYVTKILDDLAEKGLVEPAKHTCDFRGLCKNRVPQDGNGTPDGTIAECTYPKGFACMHRDRKVHEILDSQFSASAQIRELYATIDEQRHMLKLVTDMLEKYHPAATVAVPGPECELCSLVEQVRDHLRRP